MTICPDKLSVGTDANYDTIHHLFFPNYKGNSWFQQGIYIQYSNIYVTGCLNELHKDKDSTFPQTCVKSLLEMEHVLNLSLCLHN